MSRSPFQKTKLASTQSPKEASQHYVGKIKLNDSYTIHRTLYETMRLNPLEFARNKLTIKITQANRSTNMTTQTSFKKKTPAA